MATPLMSLPDQTLSKAKYVVPWKSRKEFLKVYNDVFSEDENLQRRAVSRIKTWKSRVGSKLSVAIETTGSLLESIIKHNEALREQCVPIQENFLRSCYSLAVVRFVNHVTEKGQTKATAQPIHSLAKQYGIPEWIVRIRHDATHNTLPSLDMLATAAVWALQYLKEEFWDNQTHDPADDKRCCVSLTSSGQIRKIRKALESFYELRFKEMMSKESDNDATAGEIKVLKRCLKENRTCFVKCLLEDGALISTLEQLADFGLCQEDTINQLSAHLPDKLFEFWLPVITMMNNNRAIYALATVAIFSITDDDCLRNNLLAGWLDFFLSNNWDSRNTKRRKGTKKGILSTCLPRRLLLSVCLDKINKFTIHLLKYLIDREELGEEAYIKLTDLLNISPSLGNISREDSLDEEEESEGDNVYTVEDVKEASFSYGKDSPFQPVLENVQASVGDQEMGWTICTDVVDWSKVPFGVVPSLSEGDGSSEDDVGDMSREEDNRDDSCDDKDDEEDDDNDDGGNRHTRAWKTSQRKRSVDAEEEESNENRSSPKCCKYAVNDNELL